MSHTQCVLCKHLCLVHLLPALDILGSGWHRGSLKGVDDLDSPRAQPEIILDQLLFQLWFYDFLEQTEQICAVLLRNKR